MSFQQRNSVVSLLIAISILLYFALRLMSLVRNEAFSEANVFRLWYFIITATIAGNIVVIILANIGHGILESVRTRKEPEEVSFMEDERDKLIELKGTRVAHTVSSIGILVAMLTFVTEQPPLVMFCTLIGAGLVAQIVGDVYRLSRYQRGF